MDTLETYLELQHQAGRTESRGEFTVALEKASQKLQQFQLADPSFYLLKVFQAAVASGTDEVQLELTRARLSMWFGTHEVPFSFEQLLNGLHHVLALPPSPLRHLAIGLNASLVMQPQRVSLVWWGKRGQSAALEVRDGEVVLGAAPVRPSSAGMATDNLYVFQVKKRPDGLLKGAMAAEHAAVCQRCKFAPVTVAVDGRLLRTRWASRSTAAWLAEVSQPFYLVERVTCEPEGPISVAAPPLRIYARDGNRWIRKNRERETFLFLGSCDPNENTIRCRGAYAIPVSLQGADTVSFVRDGVLLDTHTVNTEGIGAVALVRAEGLSVDLSEFQVKPDAALERTVEGVKAIWAEMLDEVGPSLDQLEAVTAESIQPNQEKLFASLTCAVLGGVIGVATAVTAHPSPPAWKCMAMLLGGGGHRSIDPAAALAAVRASRPQAQDGRGGQTPRRAHFAVQTARARTLLSRHRRAQQSRFTMGAKSRMQEAVTVR